MVESKTKTTAARAKIAHKLARYYRATPIHLLGTKGDNQPSTSHLSTSFFTQVSEELPDADSEIKITPGTPLTRKSLISKEQPKSPKHLRAENQSPLEPSSFCFPASTEEEESLLLKLSPQEIFSSLDLTPLTEFPLEESTPPT